MPQRELRLKLKRNIHFLSPFPGPGLRCFSEVIRAEAEGSFSFCRTWFTLVTLAVPAFQLSYEAADVSYSKAALACLREFLGPYFSIEICFLYAKMRVTARSSLRALSPHGWVLGCDMAKWNSFSPFKIPGSIKVFWCSFDCSPKNGTTRFDNFLLVPCLYWALLIYVLKKWRPHIKARSSAFSLIGWVKEKCLQNALES